MTLKGPQMDSHDMPTLIHAGVPLLAAWSGVWASQVCTAKTKDALHSAQNKTIVTSA